MPRTMVQEFSMRGNPSLSAKEQRQTPAELCLDCDFVGQPTKYRPGSYWMEVALWLMFLIPGIINVLWGLPTTFPVLKNLSQMTAIQFQGVVRSIATLTSRYRAEAYGPKIGRWIVFLVPGVLYSLWRRLACHEACGQCGSKLIVGLDSPYAQKYLASLTPRRASHQWVCVNCASQIFTQDSVCPTCGAELPSDRSP